MQVSLYVGIHQTQDASLAYSRFSRTRLRQASDHPLSGGSCGRDTGTRPERVPTSQTGSG